MLEKEHPQITINELHEKIRNEEIKEVQIISKKGLISLSLANVVCNDGSTYSLQLGSDVQSLHDLLRAKNIRTKHTVRRHTLKSVESVLMTVMHEFLFMFIHIGFILFIFRLQKKNNQWAKTKIVASKSKFKFKDVAGIDEVLLEMKEFVDYLSRPLIYRAMGAKIPRGALLSGPPGTGKTLLVKACAGEAEVPFYSLSGSDFVEMFGGLGASRVREIFDEAREFAPSIIFIDEIDAIGKKRAVNAGGGESERDLTLNQLLCEMDGIGEESNGQVIVFAATNTPGVLDEALLRPGRFDRNIEVTLPDLKGRRDILRIHLKGKTVEKGSFVNRESDGLFFKKSKTWIDKIGI